MKRKHGSERGQKKKGIIQNKKREMRKEYKKKGKNELIEERIHGPWGVVSHKCFVGDARVWWRCGASAHRSRTVC